MKSRFYLRRADRDDLDTVVEWMEDEDFVRFLYGDANRSPQRIRENIVQMLGRNAGNALPLGIYLIIDSAEHGPTGMVAITNISWRNRTCSMDLYVGSESMRNSFIAALAFFRTCEYCFRELNLHRITMYVYSFNTRSWRIVERSGAKRELVLRHHLLRDGEFHDLYAYGLLDREFEALYDEVTKRIPGATLEANVQAYYEALAEKDRQAQEAAS